MNAIEFTNVADFSTNYDEKELGWRVGGEKPLKELVVGDRLAGIDVRLTKEEYVYAPEQTISTGLVGIAELPQLRLTKRFEYEAMFGSHHGYLFVDTGKAYHIRSRGCGSVVCGFQFSEKVLFLVRTESEMGLSSK